MTNIATIKPGDRIIITEHVSFSEGDILKVDAFDDNGDSWAGGWRVLASQCLRILAPGDVIPKGAVTRQVRSDGTLGAEVEWPHECEYGTNLHRALVSLPEPEPTLLTDLEQLEAQVAELRKRIEEAS